MTSEDLIINTGLTDNTSKDVLRSVIGQLSDGIWENSPIMEHYWPYVKIELNNKDEVCIVISLPVATSLGCDYYHPNTRYYNWFIRRDKLGGNPIKIKRWFANKIKQIVNQERKDHPHRAIKFSDKCDTELYYIDYYDGSNEGMQVCDAYRVYKALNQEEES